MQNAIYVHILPILTDNYVHIVVEKESNAAIVVDPGDAIPIFAFLKEKQLALKAILITHHHGDHIDGISQLISQFDVPVIGPIYESPKIANLTRLVSDGETVSIGKIKFDVLHLPGHTNGHIAYICHELKIAFTGDVLFGFGCGRLFEGTPKQMYASLALLKSLSPEFKIYCTHEYTQKNAAFALQKFPENIFMQARAARVKSMRDIGLKTVPLMLAEELSTNPFLLAKNEEEFTVLRKSRDQF